jgi:hypothetical protein
VPELVIPAAYLESMSLGELQEIADRVGVGYVGLEEDALRQKLRMEGTPH